MLTIVCALQFLFGFIFFMPMCCSLAWSVFIGSQYVAADGYLLLRLWGIPKLRHSAIPGITAFQRGVILTSPLWMALISMYAFECIVP
jgi:hypothetical protein